MYGGRGYVEIVTYLKTEHACPVSVGPWTRTFLHFLDLGLLLVDGRPEQREDDTRLGVDADGGDQHLAGTLHHVGAGEHHRVVALAFLHMVRFTR